MTDQPARSYFSRRGFFHCAACAGAAAGGGGLFAAAAARAISAAAAAPGLEVVREFDYPDVQLTGGPLKAQYDRVHAHYLALDNDRLLKVFRQKAGLPAPGKDMGGWYDADGFVPAGTFGQYVSGLARIGATTGDQACHAKVRALVTGFGEALARNPNPFPGASAEKVWPAYVYDKHAIGLIDAYTYSGSRQARDLLPAVWEGAKPYISPVSVDRIGKKDPPYDETYVLSENFFNAYDITGDARWRALADHYMLDKEWFDPLARGEDVMPAKHAYSHTIALSSGGKAYLETGDPKYKAALVNAWRFMEPQRFASGGVGADEQLITPGHGALAAKLTSTTAHFETPCGSYANTKLARYLMRFTGETKYGDGLERVVYNTILGVRPPDSDGDYPYYSNYGPGAKKEFYGKKWPCCSGTLVQTVADYVKNIYFQDDRGVYVNMFAPSQVRWTGKGAGATLVQQTDYPSADTTRITVRAPAPAEFSVHVRVPGWLERPAAIWVNGKPWTGPAQPGQFAEIRRRWKDGDVVDVRLPQDFRVEPIDAENPKTVAVMRGAVMYVAVNPWPGLEKTPLALPEALKPVAGQPEAFQTQVAGKDLVFVPFFTVQDETYNTYFQRA